MYCDGKIWVGGYADNKVCIETKMANRHGLICGATGTGKTVTLKVLAESFSDAGVPVFLADVKGDLAGICNPGMMSADMQERFQRFGLEGTGFNMHGYPTVFWDVFGQGGIPLRTTVSEMGPVMLSRLLNLNDTQANLLSVAFKIADDEGLLLIDTKDLKAMLNYIGDHAKDYSDIYGNIAKTSLNTIVRGIVTLESMGAEQFFGEPGFAINDWFQSQNGQGTINVLDCRQLMSSPALYSTFLLWMMSELFEVLPEVGDMDKPRMVFFFDEAHLLFNNASKALKEKIEQVVRLIRSKGVGIYFITQSPKDIPDAVLSQLGNKIEHALRAYTETDEKAIKAAAAAFRKNPAFDTKTAISELGTGEALISVLDKDGVPGVVQRCFILPPQSQFGGILDGVRDTMVKQNNFYLKYKDMYDRDSAYEFLLRQKQIEADAIEAARQQAAFEKEQAKQQAAAAKEAARQQAAYEKEQARQQAAYEKELARQQAAAIKAEEKKKQQYQNVVKRTAASAAGTVGREIGNTVGQAVGGKFGKKLGGNVGATFGRNILGTFFKS